MVIGIDASRANRDHKTGTEWYSYYLIRWLAKLDSKNQYILYTDQPLKGGLLDLGTKQYFAPVAEEPAPAYDRDGYQKIKSPHHNFKAKVLAWPFGFFWTLGRLSWEMLLHKPDVLFVPAHSLPLLHPHKTVNTIHDVAFARDRQLYRQDEMGPQEAKYRHLLDFFIKVFTLNKYHANSLDYLNWSVRFALKHARKIITVSNFSKQEIMDIYGAKAEKLTVIYNGYNKFLYRQIADNNEIAKILDKYGIERPYLLYVGRLEKKKNVSRLVEAFAIAKESNKNIKQKLVLVGDAGFGYDEINYVIQEFNLTSEIIMPGWIAEEYIPAIYNGATAFIFPSEYEGFGIPVLQAMACRVPVAASSIPTLREVAGEAALFFDPDDVRSVARAIEKILTDSKLREQLIGLGEKRIKKFSWEKCARETLKVLNDL